MTSLQFPNMFSSIKTNVVTDKAATLSNLKLLLDTNKYELYGDPYFGTNLDTVLFSLNYGVVVDLIIDDIYTNILMFMPLLKVSRKDITVELTKTSVVAHIKATNILDYTTDMYNISLLEITD